jgi:hypothetical protein
MVQMYVNALATRTFFDWDEVMDFMWELLGMHPDNDMKSQMLTGREIVVGGTRYQFEEAESNVVALQPWEMFESIRAA